MRNARFVIGVAVLAAFVAGSAFAEEAAKKEAPAHHYIGTTKCKMCHNSATRGSQFTVWTTTKHSKAFAGLATEEAKKIAKDKGIADPQKDEKCLKCHQTGFGKPADQFEAMFKAEDGVQCEACHGAGKDYAKVMKDVKAATAAGLVAKPNQDTCVGCHNSESPTFKEFNFTADSTKIAHPYLKS